jgi:ECF sigma factor
MSDVTRILNAMEGGFSVEEVGAALGLPRATAFRVWTYARAWLTAALADRPENS